MGHRRARKLIFAVLLLGIILAVGTAGYIFLNRSITVFEAFYMSVITISTVGFAELENLSQASRPLTLVLIFSGIGLISYVLFAISQFVVEGEIRKILGRRKLDKKIALLKGHVIICGYGKIGAVIASFMKSYNQPCVIVEIDEELQATLVEDSHLHVLGDATLDEILEKAGIKSASKLIAATNSDSQNVFIVLTARELNPNLVIHSRAYVEEAEKRLIRAGADKVIFPDLIGGFRIAMGLMRPTFTNFVDVVSRSYEEGQIAVDELHVSGACSLINHSLADTKIRQDYNLIILAIRNQDGAFHFNPGKDTVIKNGDTLIAIGLRRDLNAFADNINLEGAKCE